jgi:hypothetical protein
MLSCAVTEMILGPDLHEWQRVEAKKFYSMCLVIEAVSVGVAQQGVQEHPKASCDPFAAERQEWICGFTRQLTFQVHVLASWCFQA